MNTTSRHATAALVALVALVLGGAACAQVSADLPQEVLHLVEGTLQYEKSLRQIDNSAAFVRRYISKFFIGFVHHSRRMPTPEFASQPPEIAGAIFWHSYPEKRAEVFAAFGYKFVTLEGVYARAIHVDSFRPKGDQTLGRVELFSVATCICTIAPLPRAQREATSYVKVRASGFVGPVGRFGDMGALSRYFYVTEMHQADG